MKEYAWVSNRGASGWYNCTFPYRNRNTRPRARSTKSWSILRPCRVAGTGGNAPAVLEHASVLKSHRELVDNRRIEIAIDAEFVAGIELQHRGVGLKLSGALSAQTELQMKPSSAEFSGLSGSKSEADVHPWRKMYRL